MLNDPNPQLSRAFSALADPTRRAIVERLGRGEASVGELAEPFDISLPAISRHLKVLEQAQLISRSKDAQWRRCKLNAQPLSNIAQWVERYRQFWDESFDRLSDFLVTNDQEERHGDDNRGDDGQ